jgi:ribonuclease HII
VEYEARLWAEGFRHVAGLDEAGRGAWAGPVVAGAVVLPAGEPGLPVRLEGVRDSKQTTAPQRERLLEAIQRHAVAWGVGVVSPQEIDALGIVSATRLAMEQAFRSLSPAADALLIDHLRLPGVALRQVSLPRGDALILSVAAASIVAKAHRDRLMVRLDDLYPLYGFARHKGYGTPQHRAALASWGPCAVHRHSFAPVRGAAREVGA